MKDLAIIDTINGGDLIFKSNDIKLINSTLNQAYLALFGGSDDFWGNDYLYEGNKITNYFQKELKNVVLNSTGILRLENAAKKDLKYLDDEVVVKGYITGHNRFQLDISILSYDTSFTIQDGELLADNGSSEFSSFTTGFSLDFTS